MLQNVKLVIHDPAVGGMLRDAPPVGVPDVHARRRDPHPLTGAQFGLAELVQRFLPSLPPKPQRLGTVQIAHRRQEFLLLAEMDLIHPHPPQRRLPPRRRPSLQIPQIDASRRAFGQAKLFAHPPRGRTLASLPHRVLEPFAERRFARQLRHLLRLQSAVRALHPVLLDHHRRPVFEARKMAHLALVDVGDLLGAAPAPGADQHPIPTLAPHPQLQPFGRFINLASPHPIAGPSQNPRPVVISQTAGGSRELCLRQSPVRSTRL